MTEDGQALQTELGNRGFSAESVLWTDSTVEWDSFDVVLVRSCWEYHSQLDAFQNWLDRIENVDVVLLNSADTIRWNHHKFYLRDLEQRGVSILPTTWVERSTEIDLRTVLEYDDWREVVVKPAVGTSSSGVWRTSHDEARKHQQRFEDIISSNDVLIQQFAPEIEDGERSLVFFEGSFSHATRQLPAADDFRAHPNYGGSSEPYEPPREIVEQAAAVLEAAGKELGTSPIDFTYARVDGIERGDEFLLMELELIEPYLNLDAGEDAVAVFTDAIEAGVARHATAPAENHRSSPRTDD
ncbi:ATP-grasp domain-containing protein [Haloarcula sp. AONF1]